MRRWVSEKDIEPGHYDCGTSIYSTLSVQGGCPDDCDWNEADGPATDGMGGSKSPFHEGNVMSRCARFVLELSFNFPCDSRPLLRT